MPHPGKHKLEGVERVQGPSSNKYKTRPEKQTIIRENQGGRGIPSEIETISSKVSKGEYNRVTKAAVQEIESKYYNPDPLFRLIGAANEADLRIDGHLTTALIDSGAQISTMTEKFAKRLRLKVHKLQQLLNIEGTGGGYVPYKGYVEVLLEVPEVPEFREYRLS